MLVRHAEIKDIPGILELLVQVDMVHHKGRPDLFKGPATKYNAEELKQIIGCETSPVFVCIDDDIENVAVVYMAHFDVGSLEVCFHLFYLLFRHI